MVRCAVNWWAVRGRDSVETKTGSRFFVTEVIVSALRAENGIFVTRFVGSVKSCLSQLLLLVGAIAKAKATAGTVPCSKMWSIQCLIIFHFAQFSFSTLLLGCVASYSTATRSLNAGRRGG